MRKNSVQAIVLIMTMLFYIVFTPVAMAAGGNGKGNGNAAGQGNQNGSNSSGQLNSISQRIDRIEVQLNNVISNIEAYFAQDNEVVEEEPVDESAGEEEVIEEPAADTGSGDEAVEEEEPADESAGEEEVIEEPAADTGSEDEAVEEETEEEENISGYSFIGKLNALNNQLNSVQNRLERIAEDNAEAIALQEKIEQLKTSISEQAALFDNLQSPVREKLQRDLQNQEEYRAPVNAVDPNKQWRIRFNHNFNRNTMSKLNIFVLDQNQDLVAINVTCDNVEGAVVISPVEAYVAGQAYTLYISKDVCSQQGQALKNAIKMQFNVAEPAAETSSDEAVEEDTTDEDTAGEEIIDEPAADTGNADETAEEVGESETVEENTGE